MNRWIPIDRALAIINHPKFYWGGHEDFVKLKYIQLRIDTRDNCALFQDRDGNVLSENQIKKIENLLNGESLVAWSINSNTIENE